MNVSNKKRFPEEMEEDVHWLIRLFIIPIQDFLKRYRIASKVTFELFPMDLAAADSRAFMRSLSQVHQKTVLVRS